MFGSKYINKEEIEKVKYGETADISYAMYQGELYISKKAIYEAAKKPEIVKSKINRFIREHNDTAITILRRIAWKAKGYHLNFEAYFDSVGNKISQVTFVKPQSLIDALETSQDANKNMMINGIKNYARFINHSESENKHIVAEREAAVRIRELHQDNEFLQNKLDAAERALGEIRVENVKLHNELDGKNGNNLVTFVRSDGSVSQDAIEKKPTFVERLKALFS